MDCAHMTVAGVDPRHLDAIAVCSILCSTGIFATTIHSQDFKDVDGDRAIGRRTIPIVWGTWAKYSVLVPLLVWSVGLSVLWHLDYASRAVMILLAVGVGTQYVFGRLVHDYQIAFYWYNVRCPSLPSGSELTHMCAA